MNKFGEDYFKSINYTNYLDREERYIRLANELLSYLENTKHINPQSKILDYGAAVGFLTNAIRNRGYSCDAYDISDWAKQYGKNKYRINYIEYNQSYYDVIVSLDVFEHMTDNQIDEMLNMFKTNLLVIRIPCSSDGSIFHLDVSRQDPTHINCKTKRDWELFFNTRNFYLYKNINLYTIFDSDGVMCAILKK